MSPDASVKKTHTQNPQALVNDSASGTTCGYSALLTRIREAVLPVMNAGGDSWDVAFTALAVIGDERSALRRAAVADKAERVQATLDAWEAVGA